MVLVYRLYYNYFRPLKAKYPDSLQSLSAPFLNEILKSKKVIPLYANIVNFRYKLLQGGVHYNVARVELEYSKEEEGCPSSVIIKMIHKKMNAADKIKMYLKKKYPRLSLFKETEDLISRLNSYEIELKFYRKYASELPIPTPKSYYNYEDYYNVYFFICLEDLSDHVVGQPDGFSYEVSKEIMKNLANFHTSFWNKPYFSQERTKHIWEYGGYWLGEKEMDYTRSLDTSWNRVLENIGCLLSREVLTRIQDLGRRLEEESNFITHCVHNFQPRMLIHGDYKISNLFYDPDANRVYTIDWQWFGKGCGATDISYYIYTSIPPFHKKENKSDESEEYLNSYPYYNSVEMELILSYWTTLIKNGIDHDEYPFEVFEQQYIVNVIFFTIFCIRQKFFWMLPSDIEKFKSDVVDGLHLRSVEHIEQLLVRCNTFLDHLNRDLLKNNLMKKYLS
jgi:thiamine kinase-like enzyme